MNNDILGYLCLGGICLGPFVTFAIGYVIGKGALGYSLKLERIKKEYSVDVEE